MSVHDSLTPIASLLVGSCYLVAGSIFESIYNPISGFGVALCVCSVLTLIEARVLLYAYLVTQGILSSEAILMFDPLI